MLNPEASILSMAEGLDVVEQIVKERSPGSMPISFQPGWAKLIQGALDADDSIVLVGEGGFSSYASLPPAAAMGADRVRLAGSSTMQRSFLDCVPTGPVLFLGTDCGSAAFLEYVGDWWVATPRDQWPADDEFQIQLKEHWSVEFGDRQQSLGWIGYRLDVSSWHRELHRCLLTPSEVLEGESVWQRFDDPFARAISHANAREDDGGSD